MLNANILFYIFSTLILISAFMVIVSNHPVFSLLFLVGCFLFSAFLLFLLECEFLALLFIIVYVGAIAILFLFAVMMLESKLVNLSTNRMKYIPVGFSFGLMLLIPLLSKISDPFNTTVYYNTFYLHKYQNWYDLIDSVTDIEVYGQILYSYFVLQFLIAGLILLLLLVGVVYLTKNSNNNQMLEQYRFNNRFQKEPEEDDLFTELEFYSVESKLFLLEPIIQSSNNDLFFEEIGEISYSISYSIEYDIEYDIVYEYCYEYSYTYSYSYHFKYEYEYRY